MANKPRTPPPPRQQGPRKRAGVQTPGAGRGARAPRSALLSGVLVGGVIGIAVLLFFLTRGSKHSAPSGPSPAAALIAAGCTFKTYPNQGQAHVQSLTAQVKYNSFPPTSGPHYVSPAVWGKYATSLVLVQEVHNLEHGGSIVQYGDKVPQGTVDKLVSFYDASPNGMLLAPLPQLGAKIALTAWTRLATCTHYDMGAFAAFRDDYRGKGPERFAVSSLKPGS